MTEYREILRLHSLGLSRRNIAGSVSRSRDTVSEALTRAARHALQWPLPGVPGQRGDTVSVQPVLPPL